MVARTLWSLLSPEPNLPNREPLNLKVFQQLEIPRSYSFWRQDLSLPAGSFHPRMSTRLGPHKFVEMDGSHEVLFTRPVELADKLIEASCDTEKERLP